MDWEWEDGLPGSCKWQPYAPDQISALNRACAKQSTLNLPIWHTGLPGSSRAYYTFDFDNLTQKRDTTNCVRAVRCNSPALKAQMVAASAERAASKRQQEEAAAAVTAKRRKGQGAGQGKKRQRKTYRRKDVFAKLGDLRRVEFRMGDEVGDKVLMFLAIVSSVETETETFPGSDKPETRIVKVTVKYVDTSKPASIRRLPGVASSGAFYGFHLMETRAQKRILKGNEATETSFKGKEDYKANSKGGDTQFEKLFATLLADAGPTAPTDKPAEDALKRKRSDAKLQSQSNGAKSRKDTPSADKSSVAGGKGQAAKKTAKAGTKQKPGQKPQPSNSKQSKSVHLNPQGAQGRSPGGAANKNESGDMTAANCSDCGHPFHGGDECRPRGASAAHDSAAPAPMHTATGQDDHDGRGRNPNPADDNYLVAAAKQKVAGVPAGFRKGKATTRYDNCLIHCLVQLVTKEFPNAGSRRWKEQEKRANRIRRTVVEQGLDPRVKERGGFLELDTYWAPIVKELGQDPSKYTVVCYNELGDEWHGDGSDDVLRLTNLGYAHYVPVFEGKEEQDDGAKAAKAPKAAKAAKAAARVITDCLAHRASPGVAGRAPKVRPAQCSVVHFDSALTNLNCHRWLGSALAE